MKQTAVDWIIEEINQQQKRYIDLAKKDKSLKKEVDAILTSTTLLKMKCEQAKEMEKQQIINFVNWCNSEDTKDLILDLILVGELNKKPTTKELLEIYKNK